MLDTRHIAAVLEHIAVCGRDDERLHGCRDKHRGRFGVDCSFGGNRSAGDGAADHEIATFHLHGPRSVGMNCRRKSRAWYHDALFCPTSFSLSQTNRQAEAYRTRPTTWTS